MLSALVVGKQFHKRYQSPPMAKGAAATTPIPAAMLPQPIVARALVMAAALEPAAATPMPATVPVASTAPAVLALSSDSLMLCGSCLLLRFRV